MPNDFRHLKNAGSVCLGCGRGPDVVMLKKLRTYSRSYVCGACWLNPEYAKCANENPDGTKCRHMPQDHYLGKHKKLADCNVDKCGCVRYIHGLENDHDRMYANAIGTEPKFGECHSFGNRECGAIILPDENGVIPRLCSKCTRDFIENFRQQAKDVAALLRIDENEVTPQ
jgi:hypothetical protein